ncbi:hypothetical protein KR222_009559 [Zaprionus bogoriensis]|nr:hypothetical protein KR222_009559 [Zaprionus bogoriensis]
MKTSNDKRKQVDELKPQNKLSDVAKESKSVKKKPKPKKTKATKVAANNPVAVEIKEAAKNLSAADTAKIEKKKAKKQAQKLKRQQKKSEADAKAKDATVEPKTGAKSSSTADTSATSEDGKKQAAGKKQANQKKQNNKKDKSVAKGKRNDKDPDAVKRERDPAAEAATVFVGNLPINTKRVQIVRLFQPFGTVNSIRLRTAGGKQLFKHKQRKGAGSLNAYVVMNSAEAAEKALALNGTEFKENHLRVTPAAKADGAAGASGNEHTPNEADVKRTIFVGNLKYSANEQKLREIFSSCGEIDYIRCLQDGEKGCKGVAYVCFQKPDAVGLAIELNETVLDDRPIHVERYSVKKLGAKQARDAAAATSTGAQSKSKGKQKPTGAKKRIDKKKSKENGAGAGASPKPTAQKKKSEYRGVKVDSTKKAKKPKKKTNNQLSALAKKIAPKIKN